MQTNGASTSLVPSQLPACRAKRRYLSTPRPSRPDSVAGRILQALADYGPLMACELRSMFGMPETDWRVATAMRELLATKDYRDRPRAKRAYIKDWRSDDVLGTGMNGYRAVYALGARADKPKPPPLKLAERHAKQSAKRLQQRRTPNSVFELGSKPCVISIR